MIKATQFTGYQGLVGSTLKATQARDRGCADIIDLCAQAGAKVARTPADRAAPFRLLLLTAAVALLAATPAFAEAPPRVRGVAIGVNNDSITVRERDGSTVTLKTGADTAYAYVVPSSLDAIKVNDHRPNLRHFSSRVLTFNLKMMLGFHLMLHVAQLWHTETDSLHALRTASQEPCQRYLSAWSRNRGAGFFSCSAAGDGQYCPASRDKPVVVMSAICSPAVRPPVQSGSHKQGLPTSVPRGTADIPYQRSHFRF